MPDLIDCRRLTGPSCLLGGPGAVVDVSVAEPARDAFAADWTGHARTLLDVVGWHAERVFRRDVIGGISLAVSAPPDALYAATDLCEAAYRACTDPAHAADLAAACATVATAIDAERNARLLALRDAADRHGVDCLFDDETVSVGHGCGSCAWPAREAPEPADVDWQRVHDIPVGLVTGTNGKTTTARLAAGIVRKTGLRVGLSSTDWIDVDGTILERGDYSGPGGARTVLRHPDVQAAVLETARGGLLRRGLGTARADAVAITNIAADHIGDFGCRSLAELADVKWAVTHAVAGRGRLVLGAADPILVDRGRRWNGPVAWFAVDEVASHAAVRDGDELWTLRGDAMGVVRNGQWTALCRAADVPVTLGGAARHNVANALAAAALCSGMGIDDAALGPGLCSVAADENPGRSTLFDIDGRLVLLDFAHNPAAMQAVLDLAGRLPGKRRLLAFSEAGDRPDDLLRELARTAGTFRPDRVVLSELAAYRRGREPGEVPAVLSSALTDCGVDPAGISIHQYEIDGVREALNWSEPGDILVLLILAEQDAVLGLLNERSTS